MRRGMRFGCVALMSALFVAISIGVISAGSYEPTKPYAEPETYWIKINIPAFKLTLFSGESPVKEYPIAVGNAASPSRIGTCEVVSKAKYPTWYPPDGRPPVPPGPDNPISCRWLGLSWAGYGIHGTNNPASIGRSVTLGCIRMHDKDVMELFDIIPIGTKVQFAYETVEVNCYGQEPVDMRITVYRDLYKLGTNTVERVLDSLRTSFARLMQDTEPDMMPASIPAIPDAIPDIDRQALAVLVNAAGGKPEPIPWQVRVELGVIPESIYAVGNSGYTAGGEADATASGAHGLTSEVCTAGSVIDAHMSSAARVNSADIIRTETGIAHIEGDRVLVALRPIAEAFGHKVCWDAEFQIALVNQKMVEGVVREGRLYVTPDELQRLMEEVVVTWDPQTLTLRVVPFSQAESLCVGW